MASEQITIVDAPGSEDTVRSTGEVVCVQNDLELSWKRRAVAEWY